LDYHRQHFVSSYVLAEDLGRELRSQYPSLGSVAIAKHGLRQWLRLHILSPGSLVLPSRAVFLLWHEFVGSREFDEFAQHAYGHLGGHRPGPDALKRRPVITDKAALALSFAMACVDEGGSPEHPSNLPTLFRVDDALGLQDGQHWELNCGHSVCQPRTGARCVYHDLGPHMPDELPKEVRFGVPQPFPLTGAGPSGPRFGY
jgi:hypothetical protein